MKQFQQRSEAVIDSEKRSTTLTANLKRPDCFAGWCLNAMYKIGNAMYIVSMQCIKLQLKFKSQIAVTGRE